MRYLKLVALFAVLCFSVAQVQAQEPEAETPSAATHASTAASTQQKETGKEKKPEEQPEKPPVITHHEIRVHGTALKYTATAGLLPIQNADGETEAHMFFVAYTLDNPPARRPLTFCFNGGPGSSSVWLHLGAIGPKRVRLQTDGKMPRPPFQLEDNQYTWLDQTDLVFIDPVGTGYSRAVKKELARKFWSIQGDIESVGDFIRLYLTRYERWDSPLFLAGESYGTTRAAGLSNYLLEHGIALNGIVLISTALNFQALEFAKGNELPYVLYLPSYAATAWYHKKLAPELQANLEKTLAEVKQWASTDYLQALNKGDRISPEERASVIDHLARYTGISKDYIKLTNLRIKASDFEKELLRSENRTVGRLDSRFTGIDASGVTATPDYDPLVTEERPPFTSTFNNYVRADLGYKSDERYYILGGMVKQWNWGSAARGFPDVAPDLRSAMVKNRYLKIFVASGYFDLGTPFYATHYVLDHLGLDPTLRGNITTREFDSGHMIYINDESLARLRPDVTAFIQNALK